MAGKPKLRIAHVITRMIVGGAQENTLLTCLRQLEQGHEVTLITGPTTGPEGYLLQQEPVSGLKLVVEPNLTRSFSLIPDWRAYRSLRQHFREQRYDVVHTHSSKAGILGRVAAWEERIPVVVHTVHGQAFHRNEKAWKNWFYIWSEKYSAKRCHRIFAVAQAMIDQCLEAGIGHPGLFQVVYSGMRLEPFWEALPEPELRIKLGIPEGACVVGTVARLFPLKGYEQFIPAAIAAGQQNSRLHFLLIGDGIMFDEIKALVADAGMTDRFHFAGLWFRLAKVARYIALMDMLVHLSLREGLPRAVVQALAGGKPALAFALDGTPEVVLDGKTGILLNHQDSPLKISEAILSLAQNQDLSRKLGKAGQELVREKFAWQRMGDILTEEYYHLLEGLKQPSSPHG